MVVFSVMQAMDHKPNNCSKSTTILTQWWMKSLSGRGQINVCSRFHEYRWKKYLIQTREGGGSDFTAETFIEGYMYECRQFLFHIRDTYASKGCNNNDRRFKNSAGFLRSSNVYWDKGLEEQRLIWIIYVALDYKHRVRKNKTGKGSRIFLSTYRHTRQIKHCLDWRQEHRGDYGGGNLLLHTVTTWRWEELNPQAKRKCE